MERNEGNCLVIYLERGNIRIKCVNTEMTAATDD